MLSAHSSATKPKLLLNSSCCVRPRPSTRLFTHTSNITSTVPGRYTPAPARLRPGDCPGIAGSQPRIWSCRIWTPCRRRFSAHHLHRPTSDTPFAVWEADLQPCVAPLQATLSATLVLGFCSLSLLLPAVPSLRHRHVHGLTQVQPLFVQPCCVPLVDALTH